MSKPNGVTIAKQTGWDILFTFEPRRDGLARGKVALCTHPKLPGWEIGPFRRRGNWLIDGPPGSISTEYKSLRLAIETANAFIARGTP